MNKMTGWRAALAGAAMLAGCTGVGTFDYANGTGSMVRVQNPGVATKTIAVLPFMDQRGTKYFDPMQQGQAAAHPVGDHGSFWLGMLPLVPAGYVEKEEPENSDTFVTIGRVHLNPAQDLADASVASLKQSGLFNAVYKANSLDQANTDYVWRGKVTNTYYSGSIFSYCVTYAFAIPLWIVGAPYGVSENELWVQFELVDRKTGAVVWTYDYRGRDAITQWIYARHGKDVSLYAGLMKQAMNGALYELSHRLPTLK